MSFCDFTLKQFFSSPVVESECEVAKTHLRKHAASSSTGLDQISYPEIDEMSNSALALLANKCFELTDVPTIWLTTVLIGIVKRAKSASEASSYRTIGLESCVLKFITLIIHKRLQAWIAENALLPHSQNAFREGYRTCNNAFILRCLIDKARSQKKTLYVAAVDLTNAFPSVDRSTLWVKLKRLGMAGKAFDWIRMVYARMEYIVRHNNIITVMSFFALMGILIGDTASPDFWLLFFSDFDLPEDCDDISLDGTIISHLEQADDLLLISLSAAGLQRKMNLFYLWCQVNFMIINAMKSYACLFGAVPSTLPVFTFGDNVVDIVKILVYIGMTFQTDEVNIFTEQYNTKAAKARSTAHQVLQIESMIETLPPNEGKMLYMGIVDPHLIYGCEVSLDTDLPLLEKLCSVQHSFIRRLLGLQKRSLVAPLFSETGLVPLRFRRLTIALRYLQYLLSRPADSFVRKAFNDSIALNDSRARSWVMDIHYVLSLLPTKITLPHLSNATPECIEKVITEVSKSMEVWIQTELLRCNKKVYLLQDRKEPRECYELR